MVFTVEYSCRAGMIAAYQLCGVKKKIPKLSRHDIKPSIMAKAVIKSYKPGVGVEVVRTNKSYFSKSMKLLGIVGIGTAIGYKLFK